MTYLEKQQMKTPLFITTVMRDMRHGFTSLPPAPTCPSAGIMRTSVSEYIGLPTAVLTARTWQRSISLSRSFVTTELCISSRIEESAQTLVVLDVDG